MTLYEKDGWKIAKPDKSDGWASDVLVLHNGKTYVDYISEYTPPPSRLDEYPEELYSMWYFFWAMRQ